MAEAKALAAGTPQDLIDEVKSVDFLKACLTKAQFDPDLLQDSLDACEINDLNAFILGSGDLKVEEAAHKLFLMSDEAKVALAICRKECLLAGVKFEEGQDISIDELLKENIFLTKHEPVKFSASKTLSASSVPSPLPESEHSIDFDDLTQGVSKIATMEPPSPSPKLTKQEIQDPKPIVIEATTEEISTSEPASRDVRAEDTPEKSTREASSVPDEVIETRFAASTTAPVILPSPSSLRSKILKAPVSHAPASVSSPTPKPTQVAASGSVLSSPVTPAVPQKPVRPATAQPRSSLSSSSLGRSATTKSPRTSSAVPAATPAAKSATTASAKPQLPSSMRSGGSFVNPSSTRPPIASFRNGPLARSMIIPRTAATDLIGSAAESKPVRSTFDHVSSSLLRPTKAFLAWSAHSKEGSQESAYGGRLNGFREPSKGSSQVFSTSMAGGIGASLSSSQTLRSVPQPFRLASAERHQKAQEELAKKVEEKRRVESTVLSFKASRGPPAAPSPRAADSRRQPFV